MFTRVSLVSFGSALLLAAATAPAYAVEYDKDYWANKVNATAKMDAGGIADTWAGVPIQQNYAINIAAEIPNITCKACKDRTTTQGKIGPNVGQPPAPSGLPIARLPGDVSTPKAPGSVFAADQFVQREDTHNEKNFASTQFNIWLRAAGPTAFKVRKPGQQAPVNVNFTNSVHARVAGLVTAGDIKDGDKCHSADSAAGVRLEGATDNYRFVSQEFGQPPVVEATGRVFTGAAADIQAPGRPRVERGNIDPYFMSLVDLTTGEKIATETIMRHSIEAVNGTWQLDDYGIKLVIRRDDPDAYVDLMFDQPSSWVIDPYSYSARLDYNGLDVTGELTYGDWTVTELADTVEAFYAFGADGMPYDAVTAVPPVSLFTPDHDYNYDLGAGDAAYDLVVRSVPEPTTTALAFAIFVSLPLVRRSSKFPSLAGRG